MAEPEELDEQESHFSKPIVYSPEVEQAISEVSSFFWNEKLCFAFEKLSLPELFCILTDIKCWPVPTCLNISN